MGWWGCTFVLRFCSILRHCAEGVAQPGNSIDRYISTRVSKVTCNEFSTPRLRTGISIATESLVAI